jgi:hypothetical protein
MSTSSSSKRSAEELKSSKTKSKPAPKEGALVKGLYGCPVRDAINALYNTATVLVDDKKHVLTSDQKLYGYDNAGTPSAYSFDTTVLGALRGILGPKSYRFRLSRSGTLTSGTGTFKITSSTNLTQFQEGSALAALFDECKLLGGKVVHVLGTTGGQNGFGMLVGWYPSESSTTPTTAIVSRLRDVVCFGTGYSGGPFMLSFKTQGRQWGLVTDEGVSTPRIVSGFNGTIMWCDLVGTPSNSVAYYGYLETVMGEFRART